MGKTLMLGLAALTGAALVLSGCSAPAAPGPPPRSAAASSPAPSAASSRPPSDEGSPGAPPAAAMVCGDEIRDRVAQILALPAAPVPASVWSGGLYTCAYRLPAGTLVLSVKETASPADARSWAQAAAGPGAGPIEGLANLGLPAYRSAAGTVAFAKDTFALTVDATRLGEPIGPERLSRASLAYQLATDVLACWSG